MPIEIEKKYRLTEQQRDLVLTSLSKVGAKGLENEFEVNTLYSGPGLDTTTTVLRLRRIEGRSVLTFKKRYASESPIKRQLEEETDVGDADAADRILACLGFTQSLVYEKRRQTWRYSGVEIVIDELPFGWFMEIEGTEPEIEAVEREIGVADFAAEEATYPELARLHGCVSGELIEARFASH